MGFLNNWARREYSVRRYARNRRWQYRSAIGGSGDSPQSENSRPVHRPCVFVIGSTLIDRGTVLGTASGALRQQDDGHYRPTRLHRLAFVLRRCFVGWHKALATGQHRFSRFRPGARYLWSFRCSCAAGGASDPRRAHIPRRQVCTVALLCLGLYGLKTLHETNELG
jgi:hypothetical protein